MSKKKTSKKRNWQKELRRLNRLFKHLKTEKVYPDHEDEKNPEEKTSLRDSFKNMFNYIRSYSTTRDHQLFTNLVNLDLQHLASLPFAIYPDIKQILLPQSVTGHALYGHSHFSDSAGKPMVFADASIEKVVDCINPDVSPVQQSIAQCRENLLIEFFNTLTDHIKQSAMRLVNKDGRGLMGFKYFEQVEVDIPAFLKGFYLGAMMDNLYYRQMANQVHKVDLHGAFFEMGGGEIYLVDEDRFKATGLRTRDLTDKAISLTDIQKMKEYGIVLDDQLAVRDNHTLGLYFRLKEGSGVCDDAALIYIGRRFGIDAFWGAFVADACDTYDKYVIHYKTNGYDEFFAQYFNQYWIETHHESLISQEDVVDIIFMSAEENYPKISFSSSHRRLVQYEEDSKIPTILNHLNFIKLAPVENIPLGFERFPSRDFYTILNTRSDIIKLPYW